MATHSCAFAAVSHMYGSTTTILAPFSMARVMMRGRCTHLIAEVGFQPKSMMYFDSMKSANGRSSPMTDLNDALRATSQRLEWLE